MNYKLVTDVDGILTSANISYTKDGKRQKHFSVNDSLVFDLLRGPRLEPFFEIVILSGDKGPGLDVTMARLEQLDLTENFVSCKNAKKYQWIRDHYMMGAEVIYFGDDIFDFKILSECYWGGTVSNAPEIVKKHADYVSPYEGGKNGFTDLVFTMLEVLGFNVEEELEQYMIHVQNQEEHKAI